MEKHIEMRSRKYAENKGGKLYKWVSPGNNGMPDRILILPFRPAVFIEFKDKGKKPSPLQLIRHEELRALGQIVLVLDNFIDFKKYVDVV
jgi:hypothetical protein